MNTTPSTLVLDAGFLGATYRAGALRRFARRVHARRHDVVVPEVVVWDWAEAIHRPVRQASDAIARARAELAGAGVNATMDDARLPELDDIVDAIEHDLRQLDGVRVVAATLADGAEAVRNQVLQVGTGARQAGAKTGAAESLIAAAVERCAHDRLGDRVVLCAADPLLREHLAAVDPRVRSVGAEGELWASFGTMQPSNRSVADAIAVSLGQATDDWSATEDRMSGPRFPLFEAGVVSAEGFGVAAAPASGVMGHRVTAVDAIDAFDVEVVDDDEVPRVVTARVAATLTVDRWHAGHDARACPACASREVLADVPIVAEFDEDWTFTAFDCVGAALVTPGAGARHGAGPTWPPLT